MVKLNSQKIIHNVEKNFLKKDLPLLKIGDNLKIGVKIIEGKRERVQFYEGTVIAKKNSLINRQKWLCQAIRFFTMNKLKS